jgi:hypothetical protein
MRHRSDILSQFIKAAGVRPFVRRAYQLFAHRVHPHVLKGFNEILFIADDMIEELSLPELSVIPLPVRPRGEALESAADFRERFAGITRPDQQVNMVRHQAVAVEIESKFPSQLDQAIERCLRNAMVMENWSPLRNHNRDEIYAP